MDYNVCLTGDEARFLLGVLLNAQVTITIKDSFGVVSLINKINEIAVNQPPQIKEPS